MTQHIDDSAVRESPYLTVEELARDLKVSRMTVYRMIHTGAIPSIKIGRSYRVHQTDFAAYKTQSRYMP